MNRCSIPGKGVRLSLHVQSADTGFEAEAAFQPKDIRRFLSRDNAVRA